MTLQTLCILNHAWGLVECCSRLWFAFTLTLKQESIRHNPFILYDAASETTMAITVVIFTYTIWMKGEDFLRCCTALGDISYSHSISGKRKVNKWVTQICSKVGCEISNDEMYICVVIRHPWLEIIRMGGADLALSNYPLMLKHPRRLTC